MEKPKDNNNKGKSLSWLLLISGLAVIVMGIVMFFTPLASFIGLTIFFGAIMLFSGIMEIVGFFSKEKDDRSSMALGGGILSALFGAWMLFGSVILDDTTEVIPFMFATWVMAVGVMRIVDAVSRNNEKGKIKIGSLLFGFLGTAVGFSLLFNPLMSELIVSRMIGILMIIHGFGTISLFFHFKKQFNNIKDNDTTQAA